jgi:hypothetical protein
VSVSLNSNVMVAEANAPVCQQTGDTEVYTSAFRRIFLLLRFSFVCTTVFLGFVYQAREMQIQSLTNLSLYVTMKKQRVCGFVSADICDYFCMTELRFSLKEADFLYYWITVSQSFTQNSNKTISGLLKHV